MSTYVIVDFSIRFHLRIRQNHEKISDWGERKIKRKRTEERRKSVSGWAVLVSAAPTYLVFDVPVVGFLEPRAEDDRVVGVAHVTEQGSCRVGWVFGESELGDEHAEEMSVGRLQ
jgi:hypothetical protein